MNKPKILGIALICAFAAACSKNEGRQNQPVPGAPVAEKPETNVEPTSATGVEESNEPTANLVVEKNGDVEKTILRIRLPDGPAPVVFLGEVKVAGDHPMVIEGQAMESLTVLARGEGLELLIAVRDLVDDAGGIYSIAYFFVKDLEGDRYLFLKRETNVSVALARKQFDDKLSDPNEFRAWREKSVNEIKSRTTTPSQTPPVQAPSDDVKEDEKTSRRR